ncbi:MAG TPA: Rhs element Vgr protein [Telluria sp.]|nr:Rhs element Vgr protein [Telluria sp.]
MNRARFVRRWRDRGRPLTDGEAGLAWAVFGHALDPDRVRVHARGFLPFGLQWRDTAMSPDGDIWFTPQRARPDFAAAPLHERRWFVHELTHVWQHQRGYPVLLRGALRLFLDYRYVLAPHKRLGDYDMEAQGDLLGDWFALRHLGAPEVMRQPEYVHALALFETVLADFLADPLDRASLPRWRSR